MAGQALDLDDGILAIVEDGRRRERGRGQSVQQRVKDRRDRVRVKGTYDLPAELIEAIAGVSEREDCSRSDVVAELLIRAINDYHQGGWSFEAQRVRARSLRYLWKVVLSELDASQ